ncbi:MAG: hypothetical protein WCY65_05400, partial [Candidatus Methanomethylophilaceae archaeon]
MEGRILFLRVKASALDSSDGRVILHDADYRLLELSELERVLVEAPRPLLVTVNRTQSLISPGTVSMPPELIRRSGLQEGDQVELSISQPPESVRLIRR